MRPRLVFLVGATTSLVLVSFLIPLAVLVRSAAAERAVSAAVVEAQALAPVVATASEADLRRAVSQVNAFGAHPMTVFLPDGVVIGAPAVRSLAVTEAQTGHSVTMDLDNGREVAIAVAGLRNGTAVIRTYVPPDELAEGVARSWSGLFLLGVGLMLVSLLVAAQLARSLTQPLRAAADVSYRLARGDLRARAAGGGPAEVRQVSAGLNQLAGRISELLAKERETVADLSHQLRTPLTALRIDVESLTDGMTRTRLISDLDAVERNLDTVIREADRPERDGVDSFCDAALVVRERVEFWSALADEEGRKVGVVIAADPVPVRLTANDLSTCVDALLGNVFRHTPEGTGFLVQLTKALNGGGRLVVADEGPGLPDGPVLRRGASGSGGTGLGLDIVLRTAARSGGGVRLGRSATGGAAIAVELGAPPESTPDRTSWATVAQRVRRWRPLPSRVPASRPLADVSHMQ
jgi:signal transduction histidine kinase